MQLEDMSIDHLQERENYIWEEMKTTKKKIARNIKRWQEGEISKSPFNSQVRILNELRKEFRDIRIIKRRKIKEKAEEIIK